MEAWQLVTDPLGNCLSKGKSTEALYYVSSATCDAFVQNSVSGGAVYTKTASSTYEPKILDFLGLTVLKGQLSRRTILLKSALAQG